MKPLSVFASLVTLPLAVSPLTAGMVSVILKVIFLGSWNGDRFFLDDGDQHFQALAEIFGLVAHILVRHGGLLVRFGIHERVTRRIVVEIRHGVVFQIRRINALGGLVRGLQRLAGPHVLDARAHERRALARVHMLELRDDPEFAVLLDDKSFLDVACAGHMGG